MGMIKLDVEIYECLEVDCGVDPTTFLFTKDWPDNIKVAAARGWQTHLFPTSQGWADCVISHGLLAAKDIQ